MRAVLRCPAIFCGGGRGVSALGRRAFSPVVGPGKISARAENRQKFAPPDFPFAVLSIGLSTAAGKKEFSFAAQQKAFGQTAPSREKRALLRRAKSVANAASVYRPDRRKQTASIVLEGVDACGAYNHRGARIRNLILLFNVDVRLLALDVNP